MFQNIISGKKMQKSFVVILSILDTSGQGVVKAIMQSDGNLVLYNSYDNPKFSTSTHGNPGSVLAFGQSCNFMIVSSGRILWQSRDKCGKY